jgi:choline monooxygenase
MDQQFINRVYASLEFEQKRQSPPENFPPLPIIPPGRYTSDEFLQLEKQFLWKDSWLYACHADQLELPGNYILLENVGSTIVLVRDKYGVIRAFYNSCRHRGGPLVMEASGRLNGGFSCSFHGWGYDLEGKLKGVRDRQDFVGLDTACLSLLSVRCENLGKWIFVNENPDARPLTEYLGPIAGHMSQFDLDNIRHISSSSYEVECNVKTLMETFLEVYHLHSLHPRTVDRFLDYRGSSHTLWPDGHSLMVTPNRNPEWVDPGTVGMVEFCDAAELTRKTNVSYNIYPNLITPVAPTGIPFLVMWPLDAQSSRVDCHWFSPDWGDGEPHALWQQRMENFARILREDLDFAPRLQRSVVSTGFTGSCLNYQERRIYHWHEELDRRIGSEQIPPHLRVEPVLKDMIEYND